MRNCDRGTEVEEIGEVLSKFSQKMRDSGYEEKMRREVVDAGVKVYREQVRKDEAGERPLYRRRTQDREQKEEAKRKKRNFWKKKKEKGGGGDKEIEGRIRMPIFVPYTENEELVRRFKKRAKGSGVDVVFIERTGYSIQNQLERADPYEEDGCGRDDCFPCEKEGGGTRCERRGAGYEIICKACEEVEARYSGETGRNCYIRGREHLRGYKNKKEGNVLWEHDKEFHGGEGKTEFEMQVGRVYGRDNTRRKLNEAGRILGNEGVRLNGKNEYRKSCLPTMVAHRNTINYTQ